MILPRSHTLWLAGLLLSGLPLEKTRAQEALAPWIGGMPGTEHPAAWALQQDPWAFGLQHATLWAGAADPIADQWFSAGWNPSPKAPVEPGACEIGLSARRTAPCRLETGGGSPAMRCTRPGAPGARVDRQCGTGDRGPNVDPERPKLVVGRPIRPEGYDPIAPSGAGRPRLRHRGGTRPRHRRRAPAAKARTKVRSACTTCFPCTPPSNRWRATSHTVSAWFEIKNDLGVKRIWDGLVARGDPRTEPPHRTRLHHRMDLRQRVPAHPKHPRPPACHRSPVADGWPIPHPLQLGTRRAPGLDGAGV